MEENIARIIMDIAGYFGLVPLTAAFFKIGKWNQEQKTLSILLFISVPIAICAHLIGRVLKV